MGIPLIVGVVVVLVIVLGYIKLYNRLRQLQVKVDEGGADIDVALEKRYDLLTEEIEAVKKFLQHETEIYSNITALRSGTDLDKAKLDQQNALSQEAIRSIDATISQQQAEMAALKKKMDTVPHGSRREQARQRRKNAEPPVATSNPGSNMAAQNYQQSASSLQMAQAQKLEVLASVQQGLSGVNAAVDALSEQYPVLYSYISMEHFQKSIYDAEEHLQAARRMYNSNVSLYNQTLATFPYLPVARIHGMYRAPFYGVEDSKRSYQVKF